MWEKSRLLINFNTFMLWEFLNLQERRFRYRRHHPEITVLVNKDITVTVVEVKFSLPIVADNLKIYERNPSCS